MSGRSRSDLHSYLLDSFASLPNPRSIKLTTLVSRPRRTTALFPHSTEHPKCLQVDYLVTVGYEAATPAPVHAPFSSDLTAATAGSIPPGETPSLGSSSNTETGPSTTPALPNSTAPPTPAIGDTSPNGLDQAAPRPRTVLTSALSATIYHLPAHSTSILYISKVDSSGYPANTNLPLTRTLITSFLTFLTGPTRPSPHIRVHLFARSQSQYLFPNSAEGPKRVLGGLKLCGWWKGVFEEVAGRVKELSHSAPAIPIGQNPQGATNGNGLGSGLGQKSKSVIKQESKVPAGTTIDLNYILPGYSADEARGMIGQKRTLPAGLAWSYTPPFAVPLPSGSSLIDSTRLDHGIGAADSAFACTSAEESKSTSAQTTNLRLNIANLIPSFEDDPKARFLDEIALDDVPVRSQASSSTPASASTSNVTSPRKKKDAKSKTHASAQGMNKHKAQAHAQDEHSRQLAEAALSHVSKEEFWERMGFRQECISGDVTGFFSMAVDGPAGGGAKELGTAPRGTSMTGLVAEAGQEGPRSASNAAGVTSDAAKNPIDAQGRLTTHSLTAITESAHPNEQPKPLFSTSNLLPQSPNEYLLRHELVTRLLSALTNTDFRTLATSINASEIWLSSARAILLDELGEAGLQKCMGDVMAKSEREIEIARLGGAGGNKRKDAAGEVGSGDAAGGEVKVTMLQVRKKKKVNPA